MSRKDRAARVIPVFIALATFVAFLSALSARFVSWDDDKNFLANPNYRRADYSLWGMNPAGYHLTNVALHGANAVILYFVARRVLRLSGVANRANADAELNWGVALAQEGRFAEAIDHFRDALVINPNNAEARQHLERATQLRFQQPATGRRP